MAFIFRRCVYLGHLPRFRPDVPQEQLLLSVLPEHVAVKMRQDLGTAHDGQFKKIYMSRHENVRSV
jgi:hypothetical protein